MTKNRFLRGNFGPIRAENEDVEAEVVYGAIPADLLGGQYIRNGPNPVLDLDGRPYHWFGTLKYPTKND